MALRPVEGIHNLSALRHHGAVATTKRMARIPRRRGAWRDPRFIAGVVLIAVSVLATVFLVDNARAGTALYQTTRAVAAGEVLDATNTRVVDARPGSDAYLAAGALTGSQVASRTLGEGELVPSGAVAEDGDPDHRRLMVTVSTGLPDSAGPGTHLELWFVPVDRPGADGDAAPALVAPDVTLISVGEASAGLGTPGAARIEVRVPVGDLPAVLRATGGDGSLTAVPVDG